MRLGIVGMGPVGHRLASAAGAQGHRVLWHDSSNAVPDDPSRAESLSAVLATSRVIMVAVPAGSAAAVAAETIRSGRQPEMYLDWSSATPGAKAGFGDVMGAAYVDVALLDAIGVAEPAICVAGPQASSASELITGLGFAVLDRRPNAGDAAMVKMVRSSFMKPLEALVVELLCTSGVHDPTGAALQSIDRTLGTDLQGFGRMLLETNRVHARRRAHELDDVLDSVALVTGSPLLLAARDYLGHLADVWSSPDAPAPGEDANSLVAFLTRDRPT